ncbi:Polynucleotide 5'-hydroxyl-kinase NOL9 [Trachymyrmex zeteki]|uniref:Polynucleotide 5'-hydroxyl-kinase NOL9 n=1 Tax=Mycetomoellerius zeteki TaxID=64791 RepID=A0A151WKZ8_9HYME|nr:Polynucleotide 5'-hydroxyl-kinase NOL9 [Trachymyrmex zeteki]
MKCCTLLHFRYVCDSRKLKKVRAKKIRVARKNSHKDTVNLDNACASDMQNISVSDEPVDVAIQRRVAQASHKHKKKYSDNKGSSNETSETQYFTIDSKEQGDLEQQTIGEIDTSWKNRCKLDISESETEKDTDDDWTHIAPKEKRNLGASFVDNTLVDGTTSINLPQIFEPKQMTKLNKKIICDDTLDKINSLINMHEVTMTDAKSVNSKHNDCIEITHSELASSVPSGVTKNDESEDVIDNRLKAVGINNTSSPIRNRVRKKRVKNNSPQFIDHNSATEVRRSRHTNVNLNEKVPKIYCIRNIVIVIMESGSTLCFTGKLLVKVLYGAVKIYSSVLNKSTDNTEVYSPRGYSNVVIETSEEFLEDSVEDVWTALAVRGITRDSESKLQIDVDNIQPGMAVFVLQNFENNLEWSWTFCDETFIDWNRPCEHDLCLIYSQAEVVATRNELNMEPYQGRELAMLSYLSSIVHDENDSPQYNTELSFNSNINEAVPYTAPFSSLCIVPQRLFGVPASRALNVINGNIVALCGIDLTKESPKKSTDISNLQVLTQRSPLCTCYGFGIIRGVDMERQEVFIITPLPISMMQHVNCLAGCIPVPPVLLQLHQGAPYVGGNAELPTSREPRRGYFKMKYQNKNKSSKS